MTGAYDFACVRYPPPLLQRRSCETDPITSNQIVLVASYASAFWKLHPTSTSVPTCRGASARTARPALSKIKRPARRPRWHGRGQMAERVCHLLHVPHGIHARLRSDKAAKEE